MRKRSRIMGLAGGVLLALVGCSEYEQAAVDAAFTDAVLVPHCVDDCDWLVQDAFESCLKAGEGDAVCSERAELRVGLCPERCDRPDFDCLSICTAKARAEFLDCLAHTGDRQQCRVRAFLAFQSCSGSCIEPAPPTCGRTCKRHARAAFELCLDAGGSEEVCGEKARGLLHHCLDLCKEPEPPTCEDVCELKARERFHRCLEDGGSPEQCGEHAREARLDCLEGCDEPVPLPCPIVCELDARAAFGEGLEAGDSLEACGVSSDVELAECRHRCPTDGTL